MDFSVWAFGRGPPFREVPIALGGAFTANKDPPHYLHRYSTIAIKTGIRIIVIKVKIVRTVIIVTTEMVIIVVI